MIGWSYLIFHSFDVFALVLKRLVTRIPEGIFSQLYLYAHYTRMLLQEVLAHVLKSMCSWDTFRMSCGLLLNTI